MTRAIGKYTPHGWLTFFLLAIIQLSVIWALLEAGWLAHTSILFWVSIAGLIAGSRMARLRVPDEALHLTSFFVGLGVIALAGASTLSRGDLFERVGAIAGRFLKWLEVTRGGGFGTDNLLFLLFLASIAWLVAYFGAWYVYRHGSAWPVVVGSGSALVVTVSYNDALGRYFFLFAPAAILLFAQIQGGRRAREWSEAGVEHSRRLRDSFVLQGAVAASLVIFGAVSAPNIGMSPEFVRVWQLVERPWYDMQVEFARYFGPIQVGNAGASTYGPTLALQSGVNLTDSVVMEVNMPDARRLRGVTYDRYTGQGWVTLDRERVEVSPNDTTLERASADKDRRDLEQIIRLYRTKGDLLFGASLPRAVSVATRAEMETLNLGQGGGDTQLYTDLGAIRAAAGPYRGQQYTVVSSISRASAEGLRTAGSDYPQRTWQRYTALPRSVPTRVRALAASLTRGKTNNYDKVVAVESYLRSLNYTLRPPAPPEGRDVVEFFLFESREGYCDYFSSSMVVMLRSLGIPARVVAGYLPGTYDADRDAYVIRESDSHSWPEVYFPGYGWIEFEPTASAPEVARPQTVAETEAETSAESEQATGSDPQMLEDLETAGDAGQKPEPLPEEEGGAAQPRGGLQLPTLPPEAIAGAFGALVLGLLGFRAAGYLWARQFRGLQPAEAAYAKMGLVARWLGRGRRAQQTPYEYAEGLARAVPGVAPAARFIAQAFVRQRFGSGGAAHEEPSALHGAWRSLRLSLPRGLFTGGIRRLTRRERSK